MVGMWVSGLWRLEEGLLCFRLIIKETTETAFYLLWRPADCRYVSRVVVWRYFDSITKSEYDLLFDCQRPV